MSIFSIRPRRRSGWSMMEYPRVRIKEKEGSCNRQERESCINNVKLASRRSVHPVDRGTYTKRPHEKLQRGSLENVSSNPWGEAPHDGQSSLRRTRSLAITREDIFTNLDINSNKPRRSQLIPRAKLIERTSRDQRYAQKGASAENLQDRTTIKRELSITPPDYTPPLGNRANRKAAPEAVYSSISNLASPKFIIGTEHDSLDSNYYNKTSINTAYKVSYEELPGLSLPNYYPDTKYDTDNTDAISLADDLSTESCGDNSKKYSSCDNISTGKLIYNEPESIPYDDNIVLSANRPLYDSIRENHYAKPRTIRGPTPYKSENQVYYNREKKRSYSSDSSEEKQIKDNDKISLEYFETDSNLDEINLNNENITKIIKVEERESTFDTSKIQIPETQKELETGQAKEDDDLKTNIEIEPPLEESEEYKTIVTVDPDFQEENEAEAEENKHSHNYLREFLETQKGSRKPLQNFISKKLSNLSRKSSNLIDNRFYSLPDLAASKNLRKCEKIDRKLRKCEKNAIKKPIEGGESRFIVNIGKHFDITANANIPVDFELKIAKVPRKNKNKKNKNKPEEQFIEAVRNLKETLNPKLDENHNVTKPEIVGVRTKMGDECTKEYQEKLGTMRNYWDKMVNGIDKTDKAEENPSKCKIVDVQTKIEEVKKKFEPAEEKEPEKPSKVQIARQLFERKPVEKTEKISPFIKESCNYFENGKKDNHQFESLNPNVVEIICKEEAKEKFKHKPVSKSKSIAYPEFDHVRYRVVKSDLFQKKIFANCEKESQFDGLMQYLQDYSFQELLRDNNIVIIEPIRTKIPYETTNKNTKTAKNITPLLHKHNKTDDTENSLRRHFFYHPIRVNKEVNDDELPNPDTVKQVRQFFEGGLKRSQSSQDFEGVNLKCNGKNDPDKDHCSATDSNSNPSNISDFGSQENLFDSLTDHCCERQFVSEDVLEKIRECGTTVTYYGGRVVKKQCGQPVLTKAIMEEIKNNEKRSGECNCKKVEKDGYQGVKFKLIKSNSCNSRLELVGTNDLKEAKQKYLKNKQKQLQKVKEIKEIENKQVEKNTINENIKKNQTENTQPKIIAEERKMTQWGDTMKEKTYNGISFNNRSRPKITYDYHNYDTLKIKTKTIDEMEFEPYEVA